MAYRLLAWNELPIHTVLNTANADELRIRDCVLLRMRLRILNQNPRTDSGSKFEDPHISACDLLLQDSVCSPFTVVPFYPRDAMLARVFATATCLSVRPSVCLSVCHTPVLCLAERKQDREMYTVW